MLRQAPKALAVALAFALVSIGSPSGAKGDSQGAANLVAGTATISTSSCPQCVVLGMIHVNAQNGPSGADPRGHFWIRLENGSGEFGGTVTCLNVMGMSAGLIGHIDIVKVPVENDDFHFVKGNSVYIRVTDMGSPGTLDRVNVDGGMSGTPPTTCPGPDTCCGISQGNYVVHDQPIVDTTALNELNLQIAQFESQANDPFGG